MTKKFIILSTARSGSTMLAEFLNKQQSIVCLGEVFTFDNHCYTHFINTENHKQKAKVLFKEDQISFLKNRHLYFKDYLQLIEQSYSKDIFGYKIFMEQIYYNKEFMSGNKVINSDNKLSYISALQQLKSRSSLIGLSNFIDYLKEEKIKIILLTRTNKLKQYISGELAKKTNFTYTVSDTPLKLEEKIKINFDYKLYKEFFKNIILEEAHNNQLCLDHNIPHLCVTYEDLISSNYIASFKEILSFLGDNPKNFIDIKENNNQINIKQNTFPLYDLIENYDSLLEDDRINSDVNLINWLLEGTSL